MPVRRYGSATRHHRLLRGEMEEEGRDDSKTMRQPRSFMMNCPDDVVGVVRCFLPVA